MKPEGRVKTAIKKVLSANKIWYFMPIGGPYSVAGIPDFICCWRGKFLAIEAKALGKVSNTTPSQDRKLEEITEHGGAALVVDDATQLENFLRRWMT